MRSARSASSLVKSVAEITKLARLLSVAARIGNDRLTVGQLTFFLLAAEGDARGNPLTLTQVMGAGDSILNPSISNTYKVLLAPTKTHPTGLGWLARHIDPDDERRKFLTVTDLGRAALFEMLLAAQPQAT